MARPVAVGMRVLAVALAIAAPVSAGSTRPARAEADAPYRSGKRQAEAARTPRAKPAAAPAAKASPADSAPARPVAVATPLVNLNEMLEEEGNGTVFHKGGVDDRVARASLLQPRITAWAEGSVIALEQGKLVIYGKRLPYATLYARMMKDVQERVVGLIPAVRAHRVAEIQGEWQKKKLPAEEIEAPRNDEEMTFRLAKSGELALVDDDGEVIVKVSGPLHLPAASVGATTLGAPLAPRAEDAEEPPNDRAADNAREAASLISAHSSTSPTEALHVGDKIRVGYDPSGAPPVAFIAFPVARPSSVVAIDTEQ
jgi:hypothetical protein